MKTSRGHFHSRKRTTYVRGHKAQRGARSHAHQVPPRDRYQRCLHQDLRGAVADDWMTPLAVAGVPGAKTCLVHADALLENSRSILGAASLCSALPETASLAVERRVNTFPCEDNPSRFENCLLCAVCGHGANVFVSLTGRSRLIRTRWQSAAR
jgi:hypothetical protein